jgi:hypothetical protein
MWQHKPPLQTILSRFRSNPTYPEPILILLRSLFLGLKYADPQGSTIITQAFVAFADLVTRQPISNVLHFTTATKAGELHEYNHPP